MDPVSLQDLLARGLSLAEIGRRVGRHESTVAYWVDRHGLRAVDRDRHLARGGLTCEQLEPLVEAGMTIAQIAEAVDRSGATVRHWLMRHGLKTRGKPGRPTSHAGRAPKDSQLTTARLPCPRHGETEHCLEGRGHFRCKRCRSEAVARRRRKVKAILVAEAGGRCCICGYHRNMRALHFHHLDPVLKRHTINAKGVAVALDKLRSEARKCVLLCSNCHAEVEDRMSFIPEKVRGSPG
jgi:transposase